MNYWNNSLRVNWNIVIYEQIIRTITRTIKQYLLQLECGIVNSDNLHSTKFVENLSKKKPSGSYAYGEKPLFTIRKVLQSCQQAFTKFGDWKPWISVASDSNVAQSFEQNI